MQNRDGKKEAYKEMVPTCILLKEEDCTLVNKGTDVPPYAVTVTMEVTEPSHKYAEVLSG